MFYSNLRLSCSENVDVIKTQNYNDDLNDGLCLGQKSVITFVLCFYFRRGWNWSEACGYEFVVKKGVQLLDCCFYMKEIKFQYLISFPTSLFMPLKNFAS